MNLVCSTGGDLGIQEQFPNLPNVSLVHSSQQLLGEGKWLLAEERRERERERERERGGRERERERGGRKEGGVMTLTHPEVQDVSKWKVQCVTI